MRMWGRVIVALWTVHSVTASWKHPRKPLGWVAKLAPLRGGETSTLASPTEVYVETTPFSARTPVLSSYAAVSVLIIKGNEDKEGSENNQKSSLGIRPGCMLVSTESSDSQVVLWNAKGLWGELPPDAMHALKTCNPMALWHTVALLSDVVVLVLENNATVPSEWIHALAAGLRQRVWGGGLPKGRLLVVLPDGNHTDAELLTIWKERVSPSDLPALSSHVLATLRVATPSTMDVVIQDLMTASARKPGLSKILEGPAFPAIFQRTYQSLGGEGEVPILEDFEAGDEVMMDIQDGSEAQHATNISDVTESESMISQVGDGLEGSASELAGNTAADLDPADLLDALQQQLNDLQLKQEEKWLSSDSGSLPMDFAKPANRILEDLRSKLGRVPVQYRSLVETQVGNGLRELFENHLQSLRDYYGRLYENLLDQHANDSSQWQSFAARVTDSYRQAASQAIPNLAREEQAFRDMDLDYVSSLAGLVSDMTKATELRQALVADDTDENEATAPRRAKWYEKLAARGVVLLVNYAQGWLAWKGIQRAALDREQHMPKFPLF